MKDYYSVLGVQNNASKAEIVRAYKKRLRVVHPDRFDPKSQPEEWAEANRLTQELNEAYNYLKDKYSTEDTEDLGRSQSHNTGETKREYSKSTDQQASSHENRKTERNQQQEPEQGRQSRRPHVKGAVRCSIGNLSSVHLQFLRQLRRNPNETITIRSGVEILEHAVLVASVGLFVLNARNWLQLQTVIEFNFWAGSIFLFILANISAFCAVNIARFYLSPIRPCVFLTPMYFIKVSLGEIICAYQWDVDSMTFNTTGWLKYCDVRIGTYVGRFYLPITFNYRMTRDIYDTL